jgi:hypothetical protein
VRRIIARWVSTQAPLIENASPGDTVLTVSTTNRFRAGDEVIMRNSVQGETPIYIESIIDNTHMSIEDPVRFVWRVDDDCIIEKTFHQNMVQGIYVGDPEIIPRFPAITVSATNRQSEWLTLDSTKEVYNIQISVYVRDSNQESAYRFLLEMVDTIQKGLKKNVYPLVGPYNTTTIKEDVSCNDSYIKITDTSIMERGNKIHIEDKWNVQEFMVLEVIDSETLHVHPSSGYNFSVSNNAQVIVINRFMYNSWPASIDYGKIFKGEMLKAATIDWFAWEEEIHTDYPRETNIL